MIIKLTKAQLILTEFYGHVSVKVFVLFLEAP